MKHLTILALLALPMALMAQNSTTTSTATEESLMGQLEKSKFDLMFISDSKMQKNSENDVNGVLSENLVYFGFNPSNNDNLRLDTSVVTSNTDETKTTNDWTGIGFRYARKNLLTEEKHGVNLSSEVRYHMYSSQDERESQTSGYISPRINLNKRITEKFGLNLNLREYEYLRTNSNPELSRRYYRALFSQSYSLTKKITLGTMFDYVNLKYDDAAPRKTKEHLGFLASASYSFNQKFSMDLYWDSTPFVSMDDQVFAEDWTKTASFGATLVYALF